MKNKSLVSILFALAIVPLYATVNTIVTFPGGSRNGAVQVNKNGQFSGDAQFIYSTSTFNLGVPGITVSTVTIKGVTYYFPTSQTGGAFLKTDGAGGLTWETPTTTVSGVAAPIGVFDGSVLISSPTAGFAFSGSDFIVTLAGGATAQISLDSTVTKLGSSIDLASEVTGTLPSGNLPATVVYTNTDQTISGKKTVSSSFTVTGGLLVASGVTTDSITVTGISASRPVKTSATNQLTTGQINLASSNEVTGNLPVTNLNGGTGATSSTCWKGDGTWGDCGSGGGGGSSSIETMANSVRITSPTATQNFRGTSSGIGIQSVATGSTATLTFSMLPGNTNYIQNPATGTWVNTAHGIVVSTFNATTARITSTSGIPVAINNPNFAGNYSTSLGFYFNDSLNGYIQSRNYSSLDVNSIEANNKAIVLAPNSVETLFVSPGYASVGGGTVGVMQSTFSVMGNMSIGVAPSTPSLNGLYVQGAIRNAALDASLPVCTDGSKNLTTTGCSAGSGGSSSPLEIMANNLRISSPTATAKFNGTANGIGINASASGSTATLTFSMLPGNTNYIQNGSAAQSAVFNVSSGTASDFYASTVVVNNGRTTGVFYDPDSIRLNKTNFNRNCIGFTDPDGFSISTNPVMAICDARADGLTIGTKNFTGGMVALLNIASQDSAETSSVTVDANFISARRASFYGETIFSKATYGSDPKSAGYISVSTSGAILINGSGGTSGQLLTTTGPDSQPSWTTVSGGGSSPSTGTLTIQDTAGTFWRVTVSTEGSVTTSTTATNGSFILVDNLGDHTATQMLTAGYGFSASSVTISSNAYISQGTTFYANNRGLATSRIVWQDGTVSTTAVTSGGGGGGSGDAVLSATQTWTGQNNWTTLAQSTFTYGLTVGSLTVNSGSGNLEFSNDQGSKFYQVVGSSTNATAGTCAQFTSSWTVVGVTCGTGGGGGGGSIGGTINNSDQYNAAYYSVAGSSNALSGTSNLKIYPSSMTISASTMTATGILFDYTGSSMTISSLTVVNVSQINLNNTVGITNALGVKTSTLTLTGLTSQSCIGTDGSGNVQAGTCGGGGGGSSSLEITAGLRISSPTTTVAFNSAQFTGALSGSTTAQISINTSSFTALGPDPFVNGDVTGTISTIAVSDDSHNHTGGTISGIDISNDTNLTASNGAVLSGDNISVLGVSLSTQVTGSLPAASIAAGSLGSSVIASSLSVAGFYSANIIRSNLGLAIGTNVQAYDADLDDLADGSLTGSKVGSGVPAANIATGNLGASVISSSIAVAAVGVPQINASGTPSASNYLRGDGSWGSPAGSGDAVLAATQTFSGAQTFSSSMTLSAGRLVSQTAPTDGQVLVWSSANSAWQPGSASGSGETVYVVSEGTSTSQTVATSFPVIPGLTMTLAAGATSSIHCVIISSQSGSTANGLRFGLQNISGSTTTLTVAIPNSSDATNAMHVGQLTFTGDSVASASVPALGTQLMTTIDGLVFVDSGGDISLRWGTEGGSHYIYKGSLCKVTSP